MLFSEHYGVQINGNESWFDPNLNWDTKLFLDPILVFKNNLDEFKEVNSHIKSFFKLAFEGVAQAKGSANFELRKTVLKMLSFKEPYETCLGYTNRGQYGSGIGLKFAIKLFDSMVEFINWDLEDLGDYMSPFELFSEGVGQDRISDMISNILKMELIIYTQKICNEKKIPMRRFTIQNAAYDKGLGWMHKKVDLPENPLNKRPIILVPKEFLRGDSQDVEDFVDYVLHIGNEDLRRQATSLITEGMSKSALRKIISDNKAFFKKVLEKYLDDTKKLRTTSISRGLLKGFSAKARALPAKNILI